MDLLDRIARPGGTLRKNLLFVFLVSRGPKVTQKGRLSVNMDMLDTPYPSLLRHGVEVLVITIDTPTQYDLLVFTIVYLSVVPSIVPIIHHSLPKAAETVTAVDMGGFHYYSMTVATPWTCGYVSGSAPEKCTRTIG